MSNISKRRAVLFAGAAIIAASAGVFGFHQYSGASAQPKQAAEIPVVPVNVETVNPSETRVWSEFSGRLNAVDYAEIRPEVSGRITEVRFRDGQVVRAGQILYVIDPRPFEAALAKAEANLASARTNAEYAQTELDAPRRSSRPVPLRSVSTMSAPMPSVWPTRRSRARKRKSCKPRSTPIMLT
jgi:multidrug efflux system membrane fusion protein